MINISSIFDMGGSLESQSKESVLPEKINTKPTYEDINEQKNIKSDEEYELSDEDLSFESSFVQSVEDDGEEDGDFSDDFDDLDDQMDEGGDDSFDEGGGDDWGDDGGSDGGTGGNTGSAGGVDDLDLNNGSSLNAFTQVNQKLYLIDELNKLITSIKNTISRFNDLYTDWSELNQLKDLAEILEEERGSFVMQENPENLIKLRLYQEQYAKIVNRLSVLIKEKANKKKANN